MKMSLDAQRAEIAKLCGFKEVWKPANGRFFGSSLAGRKEGSDEILRVPEYMTDLNAMQSAEKYAAEHILNADQWEQFGRELEKAHPTACLLASGCDTKKSPIDYYDLATLITELTAARRAEALLRAAGRWVEEEA